MNKEIKNLVCPYCEKTLTSLSFSGGKWQCRECGKLLDYETFKKFYVENQQNNPK